VAGKSLGDYLSDPLLQAALDSRFQTILGKFAVALDCPVNCGTKTYSAKTSRSNSGLRLALINSERAAPGDWYRPGRRQS
jgi:hypothetical protein